MVLNERYMPIEKQTVELPNGKVKEWFINKGSDVAMIVPQTEDGNVLLQKTYKHGAGEIVYEFCVGMVDAGETPIQAAGRELLEETGYTAQELIPIGHNFSSPTGSRGHYYFFFGKNCTKVQEPQLESSEQIENFTVESFAKADEFLLKTDGKTGNSTMAALAYAAAFLKNQA